MIQWIERKIDMDVARELESSLALSMIEARVLVARGIIDTEVASAFLNPSWDDLHDPFMFLEMEKAVSILGESIDKGRKILVHGDYDADGINGAALIYRALAAIGADVHFFVPDRAKDGYGLASRMMRRGVEAGLELVISVDCGSSDREIISFLAENGVRTIITDHHDISDRIPEADAFLNPKLPGETYPFKDLAGVGVAFKLLQGFQTVIQKDMGLTDLLDFVAVGTLGDYSPLTGENRALVSLGLEKLGEWNRPGFAALRQASNLVRSGFSAKQVCFNIVPRLNSPGRVGSARDVVELLVTDDSSKAGAIASEIETINSLRRSLDILVTEQASQLADVEMKKSNPNALVFSSPAWHEGVVGIGAARLAEKYSLPSALIAVRGNFGKGSARSAGIVNVREALEKCSEYLTAYGGHREAGGFTVPENKIYDFTKCFDNAVKEISELSGRESVQAYDSRAGLKDCDIAMARSMERMGPFGPGNEEPLFLIERLKVLPGAKIVGSSHIKFDAGDGDSNRGSFIGFSLARAWNPVDLAGKMVDVLANLSINQWNNRENLQLIVRGIRIRESGAD
ncbi:MAG: single-stranded-DNA-specific exonuclease RecJ [Bacteroidales bacterium]|nr:single-stranded-DNA-specific exonuclease RecJ [Candidatus Latescibacterota bacterium]